MTDNRKTAREHGILDERPLDRRRFLAHLGAGALGATVLGLTDLAGLTNAFARPIVSTTGAATAARPIYMVALGDSIMWGQGLADAQKFQTKVANWIQTTHPDRRPVQRWNFAHSGATIGGLGGLDAHHVSGQMTAAVFGRVASANRTRDYQDMPEFEPRRLRDSTWTNPGPTAVATGSGRPNEPREGDVLGGEIPRSYPSTWRQLDLAVETLRTGRDPRDAKSAVMQPVDPAEVDLVLLDGGANDVDFLGTIINLGRNGQQTYDYVRGVVEPRIRAYLPKVMEAFPNATFVLTTYYQGISQMSSLALLTPLAAVISSALGGPVISALAASQVPGLIERNIAMERAIADAYKAAVAEAPPNRVHIVSPGFAPQNGYGAPQSFLFHIEDVDPAEPGRIRECDALLGRWFNDTFVVGQTSRVDTPLWVICRDASMFHPNVAGANHYFTKIRDTLIKVSPPFMRGSPKLRVVVNGTTAGATKTVTVTAFDAQSGQPVNGTVSVGGVRGQTGAPISYRAMACTEGEPAPDANAGPVTKPTVGRGGRLGGSAVAAPPVPCSGTVVVPGYADGTFKY
jgi:hypothetical protein